VENKNKNPIAPDHAKHRERMKTRILNYGTDTLVDYELLE
jgi:DNA repair protein RadC